MTWAPLHQAPNKIKRVSSVGRFWSGRVEGKGCFLPSGRQSHPNHEDELEGVVEREPVNGIDGRFDDGEEGIHDPVL